MISALFLLSDKHKTHARIIHGRAAWPSLLMILHLKDNLPVSLQIMMGVENIAMSLVTLSVHFYLKIAKTHRNVLTDEMTMMTQQ